MTELSSAGLADLPQSVVLLFHRAGAQFDATLSQTKWHEPRETDITACTATKNDLPRLKLTPSAGKLSSHTKNDSCSSYSTSTSCLGSFFEDTLRNDTPRTRPCEYVFQRDRPK